MVFATAADTLRKFCEKSKCYTVAPSPSLSPEALVIGEAAIAGGSHMRASLILAIIGAVSCSTVGHSQTLDERVARQVLEALEGTISVEAKPQFAEGQLFGCTVEFNAIERDWIYKQGAHIRIAGGFATHLRAEKARRHAQSDPARYRPTHVELHPKPANKCIFRVRQQHNEKCCSGKLSFGRARCNIRRTPDEPNFQNNYRGLDPR